MMGRNHIIAGTSLTVGTLGSIYWLGFREQVQFEKLGFLNTFVTNVMSGVSGGAQWVWNWIVPLWGSGEILKLVLYFAIGALLLYGGTYLPDIDSKSSKLGKKIKFPGPHRGFMHSDWMLLILFAASVPEISRVLIFLWMGALWHCLTDELSNAGRVRFYPLGKWRTIAQNGGENCVVRVKYRRFTYKVGGSGEMVLLGATILFGLLGLYLVAKTMM